MLRAGEEVGCPHVTELTLHTPMTLPDAGSVQVQVTVTADSGGCTATIHTRPDAGDPAWTLHATANLAGAPAATVGTSDLAVWPPPGAQPIAVEGFYQRLADAGYAYGPAFQGLRAVWQDGQDVYAEVALPEAQRADAARYGLHPALLDAAVQAMAAGGLVGGE
ncbi:polyketide synthase dehydratase domain-containing protein, partial [Paractinoplanes durhamensis]|uniref:polyketide synthase dehydratase domain-containing protein n=1 Tax=Paractinoplanes durhamensis TaxID=113563 RepID=UPI001EF3130F